jgi:tetratricopeptide (TPR) repeat protein
MAFKRRITRKQFLKQPDEFITTTQRIVGFAQQNTRLLSSILIGVAGLVVLGGVGWLYLSSVKREVQKLEDNVVELYHRPILSVEEVKAGKIGFKSEEERYRTTLPRFQQMVDKYGWTKNAKRALLYIGDCYYGLREYEKAQQAYEEYLDKNPNDKLMGYMLLQNLGYINEAQGKLDEAIGYYQQGLKQEVSLAGLQSYLNIARCYELKQDWPQALITYKKARASFPESRNVGGIEQSIKELEAVISSANLPQPSS